MLGVDRKVIQWHRKQSKDAPKDLDPQAWKIFLAAKGRGAATSSPGVLEQTALLKLEKLKLEREKLSDALKVARGELILRTEVSSFMHDVIGLGFWAEWDRVSLEMPPNLVGLSAQQMFIEFKMEKDKMIKNCREKIAAWEAAQEAKKV